MNVVIRLQVLQLRPSIQEPELSVLPTIELASKNRGKPSESARVLSFAPPQETAGACDRARTNHHHCSCLFFKVSASRINQSVMAVLFPGFFWGERDGPRSLHCTAAAADAAADAESCAGLSTDEVHSLATIIVL
ncbi:hypothetical protein AXG93_4346s1100 [Marchantia polymorpha subsp. ruderalis]|uniref:Uncharacterized protein n=1 Tax=Marchantia polymorpha subsp. ruderalis TaxID=1480154 RepID=A0A176WTL9_MARPO|nr:hypothetical protein AXG93_4346s1100 [Marchantia polymorpha subsp. ruderalis]